MKIPLLADRTGAIAKQYGVYKEDDGMSFRFVCQQGQFFSSFIRYWCCEFG